MAETKNYVVKTLSISNGANKVFEDFFAKLEKHAVKHKLKPPKKSDLFAKLVERSNMTVEEFFS